MRVAVVMGGPSYEHEISIDTGRVVLRHLQPRHATRPVVIGRDGRFTLGREIGGAEDLDRFDADLGLPDGSPLRQARLAPLDATRELLATVDVVFLALHGAGGEDGSIQGWFEWAGLPYTGAGVTSSAVSLNKCVFKAVLVERGIPTPPHVTVFAHEWRSDPETILRRGMNLAGLPAFLKEAESGSSYGVYPVASKEQLGASLDRAFRGTSSVLWERRIEGRELTCAVLGRHDGDELETFPVVEIVPRKADYFDPASKYEPGGADEIVPAPVPDAVAAEMQRLSAEVHRITGCDGMSRTDAMLGEDGLAVLETNTIPGMTPASIFPKAAGAAGLTFEDLLDRVLELARTRRMRHDRTPGA